MTKKSVLITLTATLGLLASAARAEGWIGYMNVFDNNAGAQGGYLWGNAWGLGDLRTTVTVSNTGTHLGDRLVLEPNFNTYNAGDPYWSNGAQGNKFMEANTFVETASISSASASFAGTINSYTLAGGYNAVAFIKVLNPSNGYSMDVYQFVNLATGSSFNLDADLTAHQGKILQLGFAVTGLNANPAGGSLGSVDVSVAAPIPEPSTYSAFVGLTAAGLAVGLRRKRRA